jgi:hypothetical protein
MRVIDNFFVIFGGGRAGKQAFELLYEKGHILVIDNNVSCLLDQYLETLSVDNMLQRIQAIERNSRDFLHLKVIGDTKILVRILDQVIPQYLIPTAPVHVMAYVFKELLTEWMPNYTVEFTNPIENIPILPNGVHHFQHARTHYFSYISFDKTCAANCMGPKEFCALQHLTKQQSITEIVHDFFKTSDFFLFESEQLGPCVGGILGTSLKKAMNALHWLVTPAKINQIKIATTCNCHGVLDGLKISEKKLEI